MAKHYIMKWPTILCLVITLQGNAQDTTFSSFTPHALPNIGVMVDTLEVDVVGAIMDCETFGIKSVHLQLDHGLPIQLSVSLVHEGDTVALFHQGTFASSANIQCTFSMLSRSVALNEPPYNLSYSPMENLGEFNSGVDPNGDWVLIVHDHFGTASGTLIAWGITFGTDSLFCPVTNLYSDTGNPMMVYSDSFNTTGSNGSEPQIPYDSLSCTYEHNPSWLKFNVVESGSLSFWIRSATDHDFAIWQVGMPNELVRCSRTANSNSFGDGGLTGLDSSVVENYDTSFVLTPLEVLAGEQYLMLVNNGGYNGSGGLYDGLGMPFYLELTGSAVMGDINVDVPQTVQESSVQISSFDNGLRLNVPSPSLVQVVDLSGRSVFGPITMIGERFISLASHQVYVVVVNGLAKKVLVH